MFIKYSLKLQVIVDLFKKTACLRKQHNTGLLNEKQTNYMWERELSEKIMSKYILLLVTQREKNKANKQKKI